jgi:hypothetical protein
VNLTIQSALSYRITDKTTAAKKLNENNFGLTLLSSATVFLFATVQNTLVTLTLLSIVNWHFQFLLAVGLLK